MMFKKILEAIKELKSDINVYYREISKGFVNAQMEKETLDSLVDSLQYYVKLYNQTISVNFEDKDNAYEAVVFIPYRGNPLVFKDGKKISTDTMNGFDVDWSWDRFELLEFLFWLDAFLLCRNCISAL